MTLARLDDRLRASALWNSADVRVTTLCSLYILELFASRLRAELHLKITGVNSIKGWSAHGPDVRHALLLAP
jgi:hypothetical protein